MSGTSADGVDVALVRILGGGFKLRFHLLSHKHIGYPPSVRRAVLAAMNSQRAAVSDLSRLNFLLGSLYADAICKAQRSLGIKKIDLAGCHGQTIYHQGEVSAFLGKKIACTWQLGEGAIIAAQLRVPVVSDFRPADLAAGGKGAPLVPFLDYVAFRSLRAGRIVQNIGGIANLTAIPAGAKPEQVTAFDTGPGNMVVDQLMQSLYGRPYDRNGEVAREGNILQPLLEELLDNHYFKRRPPKTAGREEFGREYIEAFLKKRGRASKADLVATATALTAQSIARAVKSFILPGAKYRDFIVSGGGSKNSTLLKILSQETT